jgi:phage-related protein
VVIGLTALQFLNFAKSFIAFIPATVAALTGFISFLSSTVVPALLAFFSGPVGWTVLAIAAVVAMAIAFREPLTQFVSWLWKWTEFAREPFVRLWDAVVGIVTVSLNTLTGAIKAWGNEIRKIWSGDFSTLQGIVDTWRDAVVGIWTAMGEAFKTYLVEPIRNAWSTLTEFLPRAMETVRDRVVGVWTYVIDVIRNVFRGVMQFIANGINSLIDRVNYVIRGYNSIPVAPDIPQLGYVSVPAFAQGAVVTRPTLAMVGEGGEDEYIIPASKMQAASSRFLAGARGADVIPSRASSRSKSGSAPPQINVTTGPVMQQQDGSRWVSMDDFERGLQQVAEQVVGTLRTPQARTALGWS